MAVVRLSPVEYKIMARYIGPKCKVCRRYGEKLLLRGSRCSAQKCAMLRRAYGPGIHGPGKAHARGKSEYGKQLREKQVLKYAYGLLEKQFHLIFNAANRQSGQVGDNLMRMLETRLDNVVYRLGLGKSREASRQLVTHGFISVNGKSINIPSAYVEQGDTIAVRDVKRKKKNVDLLAKTLDVKAVPDWLLLDPKNLTAKVVALPTAKTVSDVIVDLKSIVELYSK